MARRLKLFIATSLDGYIAAKDGSVDWLFTDADYGYREFFASIDTVLMGSRTYEQMLSFGGFPYEGKSCFVFTRKARGKADPVTFVSGDIAEFTRGLKEEPGGDIWLVGGSEIIGALRELIDDYIISVHPIILGSGIPLFRGEGARTSLELAGVESWPSGLVQISYRRVDCNSS